MSELPKKPPRIVALRLRYKDAYDAVAMLVYLLCVYVWGLWIYPLGRDYAHLANSGADLPFLAGQLFALEVRAFGDNPVGYHLVNMALMYACMLLVYHLVNKTVRGLWWFGSLAACLFMANPVHSESMLNLSGVGDLVPCLVGLAALTAYAWGATQTRIVPMDVMALACAAFAAGAYPEYAALGAVMLAYEVLAVPRASRRLGRGIAFCVMTLAISIAAGHWREWGPFDVVQRFGPLYLVFYPIGLLPKTVEGFFARPWTLLFAVIAVVVVLALIYRKARRPELMFALIAMLLLRLVPVRIPVDWVHMIGGGQLLLPNVFFVLGLVVVVFRIMDHPRWRVPMISTTTTLVIIFFAMQWRSIKSWHDAGAYVREFQAQAAQAGKMGEFGVLPDIQFYRGAPVCLSESVRYDTPFGKAVPHKSLLPVHTDSLAFNGSWVVSWSEHGGVVALPDSGEAPVFHYFPNASQIELGTPMRPKDLWGETMFEGSVTVSFDASKRLQVELRGDQLPATLLPNSGTLRSRAEESTYLPLASSS